MLPCNKRLSKEKAELHKANDSLIQLAQVDEANLRAWSAVVRGPSGSYYEGFEFDLSINVPSDYPMVPPAIKFASKIFHPNVKFEVRFFLFLCSGYLYFA